MGFACNLGKIAVKITLAMILRRAAELASDIGLYVNGETFETVLNKTADYLFRQVAREREFSGHETTHSVEKETTHEPK